MKAKNKSWLTIHLLSLLIACCCILRFHASAQSQVQLSNPNFETKIKNTIPVSPNAAALGSYGNTPVNFSTGTTNINLPIYQTELKGIKLGVSLSYNSNGNKVESIASWVGLGWNLNVGGVINRIVQGIPDDAYNGYMSNQPRPVDFIIDNLSNPIYKNEIDDYLRMAGSGLYDFEPDMYSFSFMGYSGKFYYDQKNQKFHFLPLQNFIVEYTTAGNFIMTTDDGYKYYFEAKEFTTTGGAVCVSTFINSNPGPSITTVSSWFLTKIENSSKTETVNFQYADYVSNDETNFSKTKYILKNMYGDYATGTTPPDYSQRICSNSITISGKRLKTVQFSNGKIEFIPFDFERCDIQGDKALKQIQVFDKNGSKIKTVEFSYGYFGGPNEIGNCQYSTTTRKYYLKLNSISDLSNDIIPTKLTTEFEYNDLNVPYQGRFSFAQDFWGYYNGAETNTDLIPPAFITNPALPDWALYVSGANRKPNAAFSQFGILKKLKYPTGGYTEFIYENNDVADLPIAPEYINKSVMLEGDHIGTISYYEKEFTINYGPNYYNGFNVNGGSFVSIDFGEIGCTFNNLQATNCATLTIAGMTSGTTGFTVTSNIPSIYLPNGTYKITAQFSQNPPGFADFYFRVLWKEALLEENRLAGGLRIKKISDFDGITTAPYNVQNFEYNKPGSTKSSGTLINLPNTYETDFRDIFYTTDFEGILMTEMEFVRDFLKISSSSNSPLILGQGSYVLYENVRVNYFDNAQQGSRAIATKIVPDIISNTFPFVHISREWMRGAVLIEEISKHDAGNQVKVESSDYSYESLFSSNTSSNNSVRGLKIGYTETINYAANLPVWFPPIFVSQRIAKSLVPKTEEYEVITGAEKPDIIKRVITSKDNSGAQTTLQISEDYDYNRLQISSLRSKNSKGEELIESYKYPYDYPNDPVYTKMKDGNIISPVIEITKFNNSLAKEVLKTKSNYLLWHNTMTLESSLEQSFNGNLLEVQLRVDLYDTKGNALQYSSRDGILTSIVWGYNSLYPVAKIIGKNYNDAISQSGVDLNLINNPPNDIVLRNELSKLRNLQGNVLVSYNTYKPLIGISSETDANGRTLYYDYDSFNRLRRIKDKDGNIVKVFDYQYQANQ